MFAALRKLLFLENETVVEKISHLQNVSSGDGFLAFEIQFATPTDTRSMMQAMLFMNHDMNVHMHLRIESKTILSVYIEYASNVETVTIDDLLNDILAAERKVRNGKAY
jgi:hypothetical protein